MILGPPIPHLKLGTFLILGYILDHPCASKLEVFPQGRMFRTYVLLEYPVGSANDILVSQIRKNRLLYSKIRSSESFLELEGEVVDKRERDLVNEENNLEIIQNSATQ